MSALRIEYEDAAGSPLDLTRFQRDVLKAGARITMHARRLVVYLAEVVQPFWQQLITSVRRWRAPTDPTEVLKCSRCHRSRFSAGW